MFPFKPVALSGKVNQVSYANTRLPTEYGDEDDPGEIATITRQRGHNVFGTDQQFPSWMLPIMKKYLEKQEDMDLYRSEYRNVEEEILVIDRVVLNGQETMIQAAQRISGMGSQGMTQQGDSLSSWSERNGIQRRLVEA